LIDREPHLLQGPRVDLDARRRDRAWVGARAGFQRMNRDAVTGVNFAAKVSGGRAAHLG
jgi:hypothetical protein